MSVLCQNNHKCSNCFLQLNLSASNYFVNRIKEDFACRLFTVFIFILCSQTLHKCFRRMKSQTFVICHFQEIFIDLVEPFHVSDHSLSDFTFPPIDHV